MVEFYVDSKGEHRWRAIAKNGRIVAESGEGYKRKRDAEKGIDAAVKILEAWQIGCWDAAFAAEQAKKKTSKKKGK